MARAEYPPGPISAYVAQLEPDLLGRARTRRRIAEEVRGHLEDAVALYEEGGLSPAQAQRRAIENFGPPQVVINSWAESKGIGVVTNFTRFGGQLGVVGAIGLSLTMAYAEISWSFSIGWFAEIALAFGALLAIGMIALYLRLRGKLGRYARVGFRLIVAGLIVGFGSSMLWFAPGGVFGIVLLIVGVGLYLLGALRANVVPSGPILMWMTGFVISLVTGLVGSATGTDTGAVAAGAGYGLFSLGWVWLGAHLWSEKPALEQTHTPAAA
ncbi:MAG: permease prefix domain 1-containing protein [Actinomycetota bacterium]|nr:permease prefix domain 1-containing protein [Actinomycetota bacterium]